MEESLSLGNINWTKPVRWNLCSWRPMIYSPSITTEQFGLPYFTHKALVNASHVWLATQVTVLGRVYIASTLKPCSWKHMSSYSSLMAIEQCSLLCFTHNALGNESHVWIASSGYLWESTYRQYSETLAQDVMWLSTRWPSIISVFLNFTQKAFVNPWYDLQTPSKCVTC